MPSRLTRNELHQRKKKKGIKKYLFIIASVLLILSIGYIINIYLRVNQSFQKINNQEIVENIEKIRQEEISIKKDAFSVLIMGKDTGEFDRDGDVGRSDIMIVLTVNPNTERTTMTSIPRDTRTEIVGQGFEDKINHALALGGVSASVNTVQNLLEIPIDYFVTVDMGAFISLVDEFGGIEVTPIETFEQEGYYFVEGETQQMDGITALQYIRNRYTSTGDYGRQNRARQIIQIIAQKAINLGTLTKVQDLITIVEDNVETNFTFDDVTKLLGDVNTYFKTIEMVTLSGNGVMIDGVYYEELDSDELAKVIKVLQDNLDL